MPTTYTHWRFGDGCLKTLPEKYQLICQKYRDEFNFGVQGPDIYFYYNAMKHNEVNTFGEHFHDVAFSLNLPDLKNNYLAHDNKEACMAYLLGFLCHFMLDSYCHGYVDLKDEIEGVKHGHIEAQYDRYLLEKDGYNPVKKSVTDTLHPSKKVAHNIAQAWGKYSDEIVYKALKDQVFFLDALRDTSDIKRFILGVLMDAMGASKYRNLFYGKKTDPKCVSSNMRLDKYFDKAKEHFALISQNFIDYFEGDQEADKYFNNTFGPKRDYKSIPLLSEIDEVNYIVDFQK